MYKMFVLVAAAACLSGLSQFASAEDLSTRADRKITGEYFRPYSGSTYHRGAIMHAETLDYYGRRYTRLPAETAKEHVAEIRRNLNAAKKEFSKLEEEAKGNKKLETQLKAIQEHQAKAEEMCVKLEKGTTEGKTVADCCQSIAKELKAAEAENEKLKHLLGVDKPAETKKSGK